MKLKLLHDNILLQIVQPEEKKSGGIILPDHVQKEKPEIAKVIAIGELVKEAKEIEVGDTVLYVKYQPTEIKFDGKELLIAKPEDILAKIVS